MNFFSKDNITKLEKYLKVKQKPGMHEKLLWEKVGKFSPYFSKIPGVLYIGVGNSLAMNACHKDSDIDLFIITKKNRIWTSRILFTLFLSLMGERKTSRKHAGKFCLSFFITENALDFRDIAIKNDIYLAYWIHSLQGVINRKHSIEKFKDTNNSWIFGNTKKTMQKNTYEKLEEFLPHRKFISFFGDVFEKIVKSIFLPRTKKSFQKLGKPFGVIISDDMLKFHDQDKRKYFSTKICD